MTATRQTAPAEAGITATARFGSAVRAPWPGLATAAAADGIPLEPDQIARLAAYRRLLLLWNQRFNLTAIDDPDEVERRLFLDAVRMLPALDRAIAEIEPDSGDQIRLVDVGSGGGVPGLVLKIARPELDVTLIDATGKKVAFLREAIAELRLPGARAVQGRAEELGHDRAHRARYDLATARGVAALPALLEYCVPFLRVGGIGLFPKGMDLAGELAAGRRAAPVLGARVVAAAPLPGHETRLVVVRKIAATPERYPRRPGIPSREPLGVAAVPPMTAGRRGADRIPPRRQGEGRPSGALAPPRRNG